MPTDAASARPAPLVPERTDFLDGDAPAAAKVEAFLARALEATGSEAPSTAGALVPWICDALLSNHSVKAYGRDLMDFLRQMQAQGVTPLEVTADHVKLYKRALLEAGPDGRHGGTAPLGASRNVQAAGSQGPGLLGDG
ncbi:MAG TPA: site-specific integrase, partial [Isosphaeraceae bacterium]|nr:site-specific integrase [Isosphaeraceae bacterium]